MLNKDPKKRASSKTLYKLFFIAANNHFSRELNLSTNVCVISKNFLYLSFNIDYSLKSLKKSASISPNDQVELVYNNKYKRLRLLGMGSSGCVYLVENMQTKQKFALKAIFKDLCRNSMSEELNLLIKLKSDYIVRFEEFFDQELITFIVTEYCEVKFC